MMLTAVYLDESTDEIDTGSSYTVAGWMGALDDAAILEMRWRDLLRKYEMEYFKASEVEYCTGQLLKHREDPERSGTLSEKDKAFKNNVKKEFVDLICEDRYLVGISATILLRDWEQFHVDHPILAAALPTLYNLTYQLLLMESGLSIFEHNGACLSHQKAFLRPIIDSHEQLEPAFMQAFPVWVGKNPKASRYMLEPFFESDTDYLCLQAADCLAYEARRFVTGYVNNSDSYRLRTAMERMGQKCAHQYLINYATMQMLASVQPKPDVIPIAPKLTNRPTRQHKLRSPR